MIARRVLAGAAVVAAAAVVVILLLGGGSPYKLKLALVNASQLVKGNLVEVAGTTVGKVQDVGLTPDGQALITITVNDDYAPLRKGTRAVIRQKSLSGQVNQYVDLQVGSGTGPKLASGATVAATDTESLVNLDQLYSALDKDTRKATQDVIRGLADGTEGKTEEANRALLYLNPLLSASTRLFGELDRNDDLLERFVVKNAQFVTDVADKREQLAGLVDHFATVSTALAGRDDSLADAIRRLPGFLRKSNTTFVNLRATLNDLDPLVDAAKPVVREARPLLRDLRPFARHSRPTLRDLARTIRRPGGGNDLVELLRAQPPVARAALEKVDANGATRAATFDALTQALSDGAPELAFARPYAPELTGWFDDFSTSGAYDALGNFSRAGLQLNTMTFGPLLNPVQKAVGQATDDVNGALDDVTGALGDVTGKLPGGLGDQLDGLVQVPPLLQPEMLAAGVQVGRNNRCPGSTERSVDGSNPYKPTPDYNCDASIRPIGP